MADISKINPNGTEYDIKDAVARGMVEATKIDLTAIAEKTDTDPYIYRPSVANGDRVREDIVGASVGWNQLAPTLNNWSTNEGTKTYDSATGIATITPTNYSGNSTGIYKGYALVTGHKHLLVADVNPTNNVRMLFGSSSGDGKKLIDITGGKWNRISCIVQATFTTCVLYGQVSAGGWSSGTIQVKNVMSIDLTTLFGATIADYIYSLEQATAGSGIEWIKSYGFFTKSYYSYNAGELISVKTSGKKYVGKNIINLANSEQGGIDGTGALVAGGNMWRGTEFIKVVPNKKVTFSALSGYVDSFRIYYYDQNKNYIGRELDTYTYTIPSDCAYIKWVIYHVAPYTFTQALVNSINLQLEYGENPTTYEPYTEKNYSISDIDLRGIPKLVNNELVYDGDTYESNGDVTRKYVLINLYVGSWNTAGDSHTFYTGLSSHGIKSGTTNLILVGYDIANADWTMYTRYGDKKCGLSGTNLYVTNAQCSSTTEIKNAMNGVYLLCELATPTTETTDPYTNPQICDKNGTEEFITTSIVPVGHESTYYNYPDYMETGEYKDFRDRVDYAPEKAKWKKVGEYNSGDLVTIDGEWSEILLTTYISINNGYSMSVVYPFALFGVASLTAFNEANGEITLNSTLLNTKYVSMTGLSGAKMHVYVR